jgi:hypothetical protein
MSEFPCGKDGASIGRSPLSKPNCGNLSSETGLYLCPRMIQRIQSVYLALAVLTVGFWLFSPIGSFKWPDHELVVKSYALILNGVSGDNTSLGLFALCLGLLLAVLVVFSLLSYRNRQRQLKLGRLALVLTAGLVLMQYVLLNMSQPVLSQFTPERLIGFGFYLPPVALVFVFLAQRAIKADEELIKSLDRIR